MVLKEGLRRVAKKRKRKEKKKEEKVKEQKDPKTKRFSSSSDWWEKRAVRFHSDWSEKIRATNQILLFYSFSFSFMPKTPSMTSSQSLHSPSHVASVNGFSLFVF